MEYLTEAYRRCKESVIEVVKQDSNKLKQLDDKWKKDKDIVLEAVKQDGNVLEIADVV